MRHFPRSFLSRRDSWANIRDHKGNHNGGGPFNDTGAMDRAARYGRFLAVGTGTMTNNFASGETVVIGAQTYTFQNSLTQIAGNVIVSTTNGQTLNNLIAAINAVATDGINSIGYAGNTVANSSCKAASYSALGIIVTALIPGPFPNSVALSTTAASFTWSNSYMWQGA